MNDGPVRLGIVGYNFGRFHVQTVANLPEFELVAVADMNSAALERDAVHYGFRAYSDALEMMDREELDALSICVSPKWRQPLLEAAVARGLALFVEKPWATDSSHARVLAKICDTATAPMMTGFSFRFHPVVRKLKELLNTELGAPRMVHASYVIDWLPPETSWQWDPQNGNGFFNENSCHLFDVLCHLLGRPMQVHAEAGSFEGHPMPDAAGMVVRFQNGAIATVTCGGIGLPAFQDYPSLDLFAERGQAQLRGQQHVWNLLRWAVKGDGPLREMRAEVEQIKNTRYSEGLRHFARCVREGLTPEATVADGVRSVDLAMGLRFAYKRGTVYYMEDDM